jgi:hypothetical protein
MITVANTIEDLLEILAGLQGQSKIQIDSSDATIMYSIARQTFKGTALTDRQYALMQEKLKTYKDQFTALEYNFDLAVQSLRQPLRHIDRDKYIILVDTADVYDTPYESSKQQWKWIKIRFPFSKKMIVKIQSLTSNGKEYYHKKGSHEHYFKFNEKNTYKVVTEFKNHNFNISDEILDFYKKIENLLKEKDSYVPRISNLELINVNETAKELAEKEIGKLDKHSLIKYIDRRSRYGIVEFDETSLTGNLAQTIALRKEQQIWFKPNEFRLNDVLGALEELNRYPIVVVLDQNKEYEQLRDIYNFYRTFLPDEQQSVMFRLDSSTGSDFNEFVKNNNLNNWVDKNTKVVYINNNKLSKVLFRADWSPITAFAFNSKLSQLINSYIAETCDLNIFYESEVSPFRRYSQYYG